jgi:two-component system, cell cycle response regulator DivK
MTKQHPDRRGHQDNRQILRDLMESVGYNLIEAEDGAAGVAMAAEHRPDLILMDIQLPVLDGYVAKPFSPRQLLATIKVFWYER